VSDLPDTWEAGNDCSFGLALALLFEAD